MFNGKTLLITGGTGSFGNAVLRHFLDTGIKEIRIFSRDEKKQDDMRKLYRNPKLKFYLGDVREIKSIESAMRGVHYVFHAAALKQVPSCEFYPLEAVKTNILGTENVLNAAIAYGVEKTICLSTDKAVYPINAMGMTKGMMEKIMVAKARTIQNTDMVVCGTRYGNVLASRGSVVPLFMEQVQNNRPITITDPNMTRFVMSLDEAVELVMYAFKNGRNGDIFVKKAPAASIETIAKSIRTLLDKQNHEIKSIGTRHGEKLYETLLTREEMATAEDHGDFFRIPSDTRDLNYEVYFEEGRNITPSISEYNSHNTYQLSVEEMSKTLQGLYELQNSSLLELH